MKKIGFIGTGNVASEILKTDLFYDRKFYVYDIDFEKSHLFCEEFSEMNIEVCSSIKEVIFSSEIIVECASIKAVDEIFKYIEKFKPKNFIILSVGGVLKNFNSYQRLISKGYKIHIPSGAIAGCDALLAAKLSGIKSIELKTIKPLNSLISSNYIRKNKNLYKKIINSNKFLVFEGNVFDAVKNFPQNINVAATLAVLCGEPHKVKVKIVAKKNLNKNIHEVSIDAYSGKIFTRTENLPSPKNPKTSHLAALSVISLLEQILLK